MASSSRLERIRKLLQPDIDALPDRPITMKPAPAPVCDDSDSDGVLLETPKPPPVAASKPSAAVKPPTEEKLVPALANTDRRFGIVEGAPSTYKPTAMPKPMGLPKPTANGATAFKLPANDLQRGDLASARHHFTPIQALVKYPYKFCNWDHQQAIASAFFDKGKFWEREWDLYYIWDGDELMILVRETQVQDLLKEINIHLKLSLRITDSQREEGLVSRFPDYPQCLPRYLGRSTSRGTYDIMVSDVPSEYFRAAGESAHAPPDSGTLEEFKKMMENLWDVQKNKSKAARAKKQGERIVKQKGLVDEFKRAQRHLGLRASVGTAEAIDPYLPAPTAFDQSVVFVCVDIEAYEKDHNKITEVGVATLDTRDLAGVAPGTDGEAWRGKIRARHFRINEYRHLVNNQYVTGKPNGFEFGVSTFVSLKDAPTEVAACFRPPFGLHEHNIGVRHAQGSVISEADADEMRKNINDSIAEIDLDEKRNVVFLGHNTDADVGYLQKLGFDPLKAEGILECMDTAKMWQAWRREQQPTSVGRILNSLDIIGWGLHNAGNDAVYTAQIMLAVCVREATIRGSPALKAMREQDKAAKIAGAGHDAAQRAVEELAGWSENEANGDGGASVPPHVL